MFNSDVILTTSISEILKKREQINAKVKQAMEILYEACSIERSVGPLLMALKVYYEDHGLGQRNKVEKHTDGRSSEALPGGSGGRCADGVSHS